MNLTKRFWKQFFSFALIFSVLFSGQSIGHAEEQYTENVVPVMTSDTSPSGKASASRVFNNNFAYYAFDDRNKGSFWYSDKVQSWLEYEFETPKRIEKYAILPKWEILAPKNFTFEAWNGTEWIVLDTQNLVSWRSYEKKEFVFTNSASYNRYRINITKGFDNSVVGITEFEMMENANPTNPDPNPNPDPDPDPDPNPNPNPDPDPNPNPNPNPTGDNALLVIKMISGLEKEFELTGSEVQNFIDWYNGRADGRGKETYMFDKDFNKGPFTSRKDYVAFSKIQSFEIMEYTK